MELLLNLFVQSAQVIMALFDFYKIINCINSMVHLLIEHKINQILEFFIYDWIDSALDK